MELRSQKLGAKRIDKGCQKGMNVFEEDLRRDFTTQYTSKTINEIAQSRIGCDCVAANREEVHPQSDHSVNGEAFAGLALEFSSLVIRLPSGVSHAFRPYTLP